MVSDSNKLILQNLNVKPINPLHALKNLKHEEKVEKVLIVLVDRSGSMGEMFEAGNKIEVAWKAFKTELMPRMNNWAYGVLLFDSRVDWAVLPSLNTNALVNMNTPSLGGSTSMHDALMQARQWTKTHAKQARFILLTDGMPNDATTQDIIDESGTDIPIDTIGIGKGLDDYSYDPDFLRELSRKTGGIFVEVSSTKMLTDTIEKLSPAKRPLLGTVKA